ncbi:hypothetical protein ACWEH1_20600 [Micromonospora chersina]
MNITKPGRLLAALAVAVHLAFFAGSGWQPSEAEPSAAIVTVRQEQDQAKFDTEGPQQEGEHRESAVGTSGSGAATVHLTPAVMKLEAVPVVPVPIPVA